MSKHNKYLQFQEHMDNNKQLGLGTVRLKETNIFMQLQNHIQTFEEWNLIDLPYMHWFKTLGWLLYQPKRLQ